MPKQTKKRPKETDQALTQRAEEEREDRWNLRPRRLADCIGQTAVVEAMRIAIPPVINQYLNFTKNTSLGIAVGYAEVTLIAFQAIGNGQPAPQLILMLMAAYLTFSLTISLLVNYLNRRLRYVTR